MPLIHGKSDKAFKQNIRTEYKEGKPLKQSLAIAYDMQRKAKRKKMAEGGSPSPMPSPSPVPIDPDKAQTFQDAMRKQRKFGFAKGGFIGSYQSPSTRMHQTNDEGIDEMESGYMSHEGNMVRRNDPAMMEDDRRLGQHGAMEQGPVPALSPDEEDVVDRIMEQRSKDYSRLDRYFEGGDIDDRTSPDPDHPDITFDTEDNSAAGVAKGLSKALGYSKGGRVANQDHGEDNNEMAGFSPNEFDDLVLRDDLESTYGDDDNAGDALGNKQEDEDREDIVSRIMASRRKKDRLPSPA